MEIFILILLAIVILFLIWDRFWEGKKWREQGDALTRLVGEHHPLADGKALRGRTR